MCYAFKSLSALPALQQVLWAQVCGLGGLPYPGASACLQRTKDLNNVYWFERTESSTLGSRLNVSTDGGRHLRLPSTERAGDMNHVRNHQYDALKSSPMSPLGKPGLNLPALGGKFGIICSSEDRKNSKLANTELRSPKRTDSFRL